MGLTRSDTTRLCRLCRSRSDFIKANWIPEVFFRELRRGDGAPLIIADRAQPVERAPILCHPLACHVGSAVVAEPLTAPGRASAFCRRIPLCVHPLGVGSGSSQTDKRSLEI